MNQNFFSTINKNKTRCNNEIDKTDNNKSKCQNINCNSCHRCCCVVGPTGPTGPAGTPGGPTGPTERLFKSSNKIIIDSS